MSNNCISFTFLVLLLQTVALPSDGIFFYHNQDIRWRGWVVSPLCSDAVGVFYSPSRLGWRSFTLRYITKLSQSKLFKQDSKGISLATHFQTGVEIFKLTRALKLITLIKIVEQRIFHSLALRSPRINMQALSTTLHAAFINSAFSWTADIWSMYSRVPLNILIYA